MTHDDLRELLGAYALDALPPAERGELEAHLQTCAHCRAEADELTGVSDRLALLAIERDPPPALRDQLLALVEQDRAEWLRARADGSVAAGAPDREAGTMAQGAAVTRRGVFPERRRAETRRKRLIERVRRAPRIAFGAGAAVVLIVLGVLLFNRNNVNIVRTYACAPAQQTLVDGNDYTPTSCALSVRSDHSITVAFTNLPVLARMQAYELWMLPARGHPVPVTGFVPNGDQSFYNIYGYHIDIGKYANAAVTIERAPGNSPAPRGPIVLVIPLAHPLKVQS